MSRANYIVALAWAFLVLGCSQESRIGHDSAARELFEQTVKQFHLPSAEANGPERDKLLAGAVEGYTRLLRQYPDQRLWCAEALRSLANVRAEQGRLNDAVRLYQQVGDRYPGSDWEILQAWKSAGDLLWDAGRADEARAFYRQIVQRFAGRIEPPLVQTVVAAAQRRLVGS